MGQMSKPLTETFEAFQGPVLCFFGQIAIGIDAGGEQHTLLKPVDNVQPVANDAGHEQVETVRSEIDRRDFCDR
jgi:hypothetical protein